MTSFLSNYKKMNMAIGWLTFAIALTVYTLTLEPTLSFWDAGEYLSTSSKLEVGHPPGAPLYQMLGAVFSTFASDSSQIAFAVNMLAAVSSAFTILFMFWVTTNLLRKLVIRDEQKESVISNWAIIGSAFVGSLAFTFSDSFWFSAVEAEVYATAMFLTSLLLWLAVRWIDDESERSSRWLLMIGLVVGLSFGVHFMALLTIPSIGYLYYFKKQKTVTPKSFLIASAVIVAILLFTFLYLMPYTMMFFAKSELFFVNSIGLPFNSGTTIAFLLIAVAFTSTIYYSHKKNKKAMNQIALTILFVFIGFSSWLMLPIRANTQVPINENKPSDATEMIDYYYRKQYGERSLFYDTYFTMKYNPTLDKKTPYVDGTPNYERNEKTGKYEVINNYIKSEPNYSNHLKGFLPRMWSTDGSHPVNYMNYAGPVKLITKPGASNDAVNFAAEINAAVKSGKVTYKEYEGYLQDILNNPQFGDEFDVENPTFFQNIKFMFEYQFGYMYWRYFMWNFVGRQNDLQGTNGTERGNWESGVTFVDEMRLGKQSHLPSDLANNKGKNHYYFLPFLIGLIGFFYHSKKDMKSFFVLLTLFLLTSLALKVFLNERPFEPRERDYAVVASFMVFGMWISFGAYAIFDFIKSKLSAKVALPIAFMTTFLAAPVLMAKENWDDHDRSDKYTALAVAKAYLSSLDPNAIIFTIGDNDTFPLWYAQEVEGYRTDVRVVNTALLQSEWYIDQMKVKAHDADPIKIRFNHKQYVGNNLYYGAIFPSEERYDINDVLNYIASDDPRTKIQGSNDIPIVKIPTNKISIPVDKNEVLKHKIVSEQFADQIVSQIDIDIKSSALYRQRIIMLDIIANNLWERPIYFTTGSLGDEDFLWMKDYLQLSGITYKLVPIKSDSRKAIHPLDIGAIDSEKMYQIVTNWYWGNMGSNKIYHDPETRKNAFMFRISLSRLAEQLINEGKLDKAEKVADIAVENMPIEFYNEEYMTAEPFVEIYYAVGNQEKGRALAMELGTKYKEWLDYFASMNKSDQEYNIYEIIDNLKSLYRIEEVAKKDTKIDQVRTHLNIAHYNQVFKKYLDIYIEQQRRQEAQMRTQLEAQKDSIE